MFKDHFQNTDLILTFNPNNLSAWKENYMVYVKANFKFAGDMLQSLKAPNFITNPILAPYPMPSSKSFEFLVLTNSFKEEHENKKDYYSMLERLTGDLILHLSPESKMKIQFDKERYEEAFKNNNAMELWKMINETHSHHGASITFLDKKIAQKQLENIKQNDLSLEYHSKNFDIQISKMKSLGIELEDKEVIFTFLTSLNSSYNSKVTELMSQIEDVDKFPKSLADCKKLIEKVRTAYSQIGLSMDGNIKNDDQSELIGSSLANVTVSKSIKLNDNNVQIADFKKSDDDDRCAFCNIKNHNAQNCRFLKSFKTSNSEMIEEHIKSNRNKNKSKKSVVNFSIANDNLKKFAFTTKKVSFISGVDTNNLRRESIILDNAANISIINNLNLSINQTQLSTPIEVTGISNTVVKSNIFCDTKFFGKALYIPQSPFNIIAFCELKKVYEIVYIQNTDSFEFRNKSNQKEVFIFQATSEGLYAIIDKNNNLMSLSNATPFCFIQHGEKFYSTEQIARATNVIKLHETMGHIGDHALSVLLDNGGILNCPYTSADLRVARAVHGKCIHCIAGKDTRPIAPISMNPPAESPGIILHMDIMFIKTDPTKPKSPFLIAVDDQTNFIMCYDLLRNKTTANLVQAQKKIIFKWRSFGHNVKEIHTDRENVFNATEPFLNEIYISLKVSAPEQHNRKAERYIRVVKERIRTITSSLPFQIPYKLTTSIVLDTIKTLNMSPNSRTGVRSPYEIVKGIKIDAKKHLIASFGTIGMFKTPNQLDGDELTPRSELGYVVGRDLDSQCTILAYIPSKNRILSFQKYTPIDLTSDIIRIFNAAANQNNDLIISKSTIEKIYDSSHNNSLSNKKHMILISLLTM